MNNFQDIVEFLIDYPPFALIDATDLELVAGRISITYMKAGEDLFTDTTSHYLSIIRNGSVEVRDKSGLLVDRLEAGACFGFTALLTGNTGIYRYTPLEDGLLFLINKNDFTHLRHTSEAFDQFFTRACLNRTLSRNQSLSKDLEFDLSIEHIMQTDLVTAQTDVPIWQAAKIMTQKKVSSILICEQGKLIGIVTDRDLRTRVLAEQRSTEDSVSSIMTSNPFSLNQKESVYQAYLTMMVHQIHHLPITCDEKPVGFISLSDLLRAKNSEPLFLIKAIHRATDESDLAELAKSLPSLIEKLIIADVTPNEISRIITTLTDSLTRKLQSLAIQRLGAPPCEYCFLAFGSQGRVEQTLNSDQDNAILTAKELSPGDKAYFLNLATIVCDGLHRCGIVYCPGEIMAKNPKWCLSLDEWQSQFFQWIDSPTPNAILNISIFFDMRMISGNKTLFHTLQNSIFERAKHNSIFHAHLSEAAMRNRPPLGFFKTFVLERDGNHKSTLDLKHRGLAPIIDLVRLYCLSEGIPTSNTLERLAQLKERKVLHAETANNLIDAYQYIAELRIENQQNQLKQGEPVSNHFAPSAFSHLVRQQLKDAFAVVQEGQQNAKQKFGHGIV